MAEQCTVINCTEQAKWQCFVHSGNDTRQSPHSVFATYCDEHLASQKQRMDAHEFLVLTDIERLPECSCAMTEETFRSCPVHGEDAPDPDVVQEVLATRETSEITNIRPLKGTTVTNKETLSAEIDRLQEKNDELNETVRRLNADNQNLEGVNTSLNNSVRTADAAIGRLKSTNDRLAEEIGDLRKNRDALVEHLHALANAFEAEGSMVYRDTIDEKLEELGLPSRLKHFHLVFTVPVQIRLEGDYPSEAAMQTAFEAGSLNWNVSDYEETLDDDSKIILIEEAPQ